MSRARLISASPGSVARATDAEKRPEPIRAWLPQSMKGHATSYVVNQLSIGLFSASVGPDIRLLTCQILSNLFGSTSVINKGFITLLTYLQVGNKILNTLNGGILRLS